MSTDTEIESPNHIDHISTDILIIGSGLAGMQLTFAILKEESLKDKTILIVDPMKADKKTWCFWEQGKGLWDDIVFKKWDHAVFVDPKESHHLNMGSYSYKMIRSEDLKNHFDRFTATEERIKILKDEILDVDRNKSFALTESLHIEAEYILDSRYDPAELLGIEEPTVLQHFKGWFIKTKEDVFESEKFTMMDFTSSPSDECSFMYILPFSKTEALLEFTFFSPHLKEESSYDELIQKYIDQNYPNLEFEVIESEQGVIPMSSYNFQDLNTTNYCRIGTAGGWVKASSGYSFKMTEKRSRQLVQNLVNRKPLDKGLFTKKFQFYDRIFLSILENENYLGNGIFQEMYKKNECHSIFKFLDEESTLKDDLLIIFNFKPAPFLRAVKRELIQ